MVDLAGEVALVAGGGGGVGSAISRRLAAEGAAVAVVGRSPGPAQAVVERITEEGGKAMAVCADISDTQDVSRMFKDVAVHLGSPSILVDSAAVAGPFGPVGLVDAEEWWGAISVHLKGPMLLLGEALPSMLRVGKGRVIIVSSFLGETVYPHLSAYSIGKGAQMTLIAHAAEEHKNSGVSFFAIQPRAAYTKMAEVRMNSPDFKSWAPEAKSRLQKILEENDDSDEDSINMCAERCVCLASGRYDRLSGRLLDPRDNLDVLLSFRKRISP